MVEALVLQVAAGVVAVGLPDAGSRAGAALVHRFSAAPFEGFEEVSGFRDGVAGQLEVGELDWELRSRPENKRRFPPLELAAGRAKTPDVLFLSAFPWKKSRALSLESDLGHKGVRMRRPAVAGRTRLLATSDRRSSSRPGASRRTIARKIVSLFRRPVGCVTWAGERRWP